MFTNREQPLIVNAKLPFDLSHIHQYPFFRINKLRALRKQPEQNASQTSRMNQYQMVVLIHPHFPLVCGGRDWASES